MMKKNAESLESNIILSTESNKLIENNEAIENKNTNDTLRKKSSDKNYIYSPLDPCEIDVISQGMSKKLHKRKYTLEEEIISFQADFVPKLKPIKMKLVPSKFNLNDKKKIEKNNSCPCLDYVDLDEYEDEDDENEILEIEGTTTQKNIKNTRKDLIKIKDCDEIPHSLTKQVINNNNILNEDEKIIDSIIFEENIQNDEFDIFPEVEPIGEKTPKPKVDYDKLIKTGKNNYNWSAFHKCEDEAIKKKKTVSIIDILKMKHNHDQ